MRLSPARRVLCLVPCDVHDKSCHWRKLFLTLYGITMTKIDERWTSVSVVIFPNKNQYFNIKIQHQSLWTSWKSDCIKQKKLYVMFSFLFTPPGLLTNLLWRRYMIIYWANQWHCKENGSLELILRWAVLIGYSNDSIMLLSNQQPC